MMDLHISVDVDVHGIAKAGDSGGIYINSICCNKFNMQNGTARKRARLMVSTVPKYIKQLNIVE